MSPEIEQLLDVLDWIRVQEFQTTTNEARQKTKEQAATLLTAIIDARVTAAIKEYDRKRNA